MGDLSLLIRNAATGSSVEAELPDDAEMRELLPTLAKNLCISNTGKLRLMNKTQNFEYNDSDTLEEVVENSQEAILIHMKALTLTGKSIPTLTPVEKLKSNEIYKNDIWTIVNEKNGTGPCLSRFSLFVLGR